MAFVIEDDTPTPQTGRFVVEQDQPSQEQPSIASQITAPFQRVGRAASNVAGAVVEPVMQMATGFAAKPMGELAAFGTMAANKMTGNEVDPAAMARTVQEQLTYQPRTAGGQAVAQNILAPIGGALESGAGAIGQGASNLSQTLGVSPETSNLVGAGIKEAALQGLGLLGVKGAPKAAARIEASNAAKLAEIASKNAQDSARIDAAKLAVEKYGLSLDPLVSNPTFMNRVRVSAADRDKLTSLNRRVNESKISDILKQDVGIPATDKLSDVSTFEKVRNIAGQAEDQINGMAGGFVDNGSSAATISNIIPKDAGSLIGGKAIVKKLTEKIDNVNKLLIQPAIDGESLTTQIRDLRKNASSIYEKDNIKPAQRAIADGYMGIANELEALIDRNLAKTNPTLLKQYQDGRVIMAKSYALQKATNLNTGLVDPMILAKITSKDNTLTGAFSDIGKIAGNFPESLGIKPGAQGGLKEAAGTHITRTGLGGSIGLVAGSTMGLPVSGMIAGASLGELAGSLYANRLATNAALQSKVSVPSAGMLSIPRRIAPEATRAGMLGTAFSPYIKEEQP